MQRCSTNSVLRSSRFPLHGLGHWLKPIASQSADFSIAGKNVGISGKNGKLTNVYKKVILTFEPDFFVFENVKGLWSTKKHREEYNKIKKSFSRKGYVYTNKLVNALEYGVPQDRERIILFAIKSNLLHNDKKTARKILKSNFCWGNSQNYSLNRIKKIDWPDTSPFLVDGEIEMPDSIIKELTVEYWFKKIMYITIIIGMIIFLLNQLRDLIQFQRVM